MGGKVIGRTNADGSGVTEFGWSRDRHIQIGRAHV